MGKQIKSKKYPGKFWGMAQGGHLLINYVIDNKVVLESVSPQKARVVRLAKDLAKEIDDDIEVVEVEITFKSKV